MDNTTYEYFIRRAWECERFQKGANTDTWQELLQYKYEFDNAVIQTEKIKAEKKFQKAFQQIKKYIDDAYDRLIKRSAEKKLPQTDIKTFLDLRKIADNTKTPVELYQVMRESFEIINRNEL